MRPRVAEFRLRQMRIPFIHTVSIVKMMITMFKSGVQACAGLTKMPEDSEKNVVFKMYTYHNYLAEHELRVIQRIHQSVDPSTATCFPTPFGLREVYSRSLGAKRIENQLPFEWEHRPPLITRTIFLMEHIDGQSLGHHIRSKDSPLSTTVLIDILIQVFVALDVAHKACGFTHYDLHTSNIIIRMHEDMPVPVIIDFGFSYVDRCDDYHLSSAVEHASCGVTSYRPDSCADARRLGICAAYEIHKHRRSDVSLRLQTVISRLFDDQCRMYGIATDGGLRSAGHVLALQPNAVDIALENIVKHTAVEYNSTFVEYTTYSIELLTTAIKMPLPSPERTTYFHWTVDVNEIAETAATRHFATFYRYFGRIEHAFGDPGHSMYALKCIMDIARNPDRDPMSLGDTLRMFAQFFVMPRSVDCQKMLEAVRALAASMALMYGLMFTHDRVYRFPSVPTAGDLVTALTAEFRAVAQ